MTSKKEKWLAHYFDEVFDIQLRLRMWDARDEAGASNQEIVHAVIDELWENMSAMERSLFVARLVARVELNRKRADELPF